MGCSPARSSAAVAAFLLLALAWPAGKAMAQCAPAAVGATPSGATVNCNGIVLNQNLPDGYGTGQQNNDTINVQTGGQVLGLNNGFNIGDNNTVNLATGTIVNGGLAGITENGSGTLTVNNNNGGTIMGSGANSLVNGIVSPGSATIMNTGSITGTTTAAGGSGLAINVTTSVNVTNASGAQITGTGNGGEAVGIQSNALTLNNSGTVSASGGVSIGTFTVFGLNSTNVTNGGTISADGTAGGTAIAVVSEGTLNVTNNAGSTIQATGAVSAAIAGEGSATTISNAGTVAGDLDAIFLTGPATITNTGTMTGGNAAINASLATGAMTLNQNAGTINGTIALSANADVVNVGGGVINGNIVGQGTLDTVNFAPGSGSFTYNDNFTGINQVNVNSGTVILNGSDSATNLAVTGGVLAGAGTIQTAMTINSGGVFAPGTPGTPGTSMTINGSLVFQSAAIYMVQLNPATSTFTNVSGTAALAGTVLADFLPGSYLVKQYTILQSAGLGGTQFSGLNTIDLPPGFTASLVYSADDVFLDLSPVSLSTTGLNQNQKNVANAINNFFNNGGALPPSFVGILGLSGANLGSALSQLDGEVATGAQSSAFKLMTQFLGLLSDPFDEGRGGGGGSLISGFAPEQEADLPPEIALAYAGILKAPPKTTAFDQRWSVWGAGYGGSATIDGNAAIGSNRLTASTFGGAAGIDYHVTPNTVLGFALSGGGTNWNLAEGLGNGRSDAFLAGVYAKTYMGAGYVTAALAFANHWMTTSRIVLGDQATANFNAQDYAGRIEAGYRYGAPMQGTAMAIIPYAALQAQDFHAPAYSETDLTGGGFGLSFADTDATDTRSELGARFENLTTLNGLPLLLGAKTAWAHDWVGNPTDAAVFEALPGATFIVSGAAQPKDSVLLSGAAQIWFTPNWSFLAKFDGEFASTAQTYAGSGTLRYSW
jgi:uncharacterized protein with beta-barrel porin domain